MRNIYFAFVVLTMSKSLSAQKLTKNEAKRLLETSFNYLKMSDSVSFVNMWYFDETPRPVTNKVYKKESAYESYRELKQFLDTALTKICPSMK